MPPKFRFLDPDATEEAIRTDAARRDLTQWAAAVADISSLPKGDKRLDAARKRAAEAYAKATAHPITIQESALSALVSNWEGEYVSHRTRKDMIEEGAATDDGTDHVHVMAVLEAGLAVLGKELDRVQAEVAKVTPQVEEPDQENPPGPPEGGDPVEFVEEVIPGRPEDPEKPVGWDDVAHAEDGTPIEDEGPNRPAPQEKEKTRR